MLFPAVSRVFTALVLAFTVTCTAQVLSLQTWQQEKALAVANHDYSDPAIERFKFLPPLPSAHGDAAENLELLDICIVASVDGKLHALNRTSGDVLWSMSSSSTSATAPDVFGPLVRTQHVEYDPFLEEAEHRERYIIEPQTGDIYVLPNPDSPLYRMPYSMPQLVDMSPLNFGDDNRVFVGKRETTLLVLELETGRVKRTINSECPWEPDEEQGLMQQLDLDLDELDGTKPSKLPLTSTELYIGRTGSSACNPHLPQILMFPRLSRLNLHFSIPPVTETSRAKPGVFHLWAK